MAGTFEDFVFDVAGGNLRIGNSVGDLLMMPLVIIMGSIMTERVPKWMLVQEYYERRAFFLMDRSQRFSIGFELVLLGETSVLGHPIA